MTREELKKKAEIYELLDNINDYLVVKFFDSDSNELLDEKLEVLKALDAGEKPADIPNYYKVLELMPKEGHWD